MARVTKKSSDLNPQSLQNLPSKHSRPVANAQRSTATPASDEPLTLSNSDSLRVRGQVWEAPELFERPKKLPLSKLSAPQSSQSSSAKEKEKILAEDIEKRRKIVNALKRLDRSAYSLALNKIRMQYKDMVLTFPSTDYLTPLWKLCFYETIKEYRERLSEFAKLEPDSFRSQASQASVLLSDFHKFLRTSSAFFETELLVKLREKLVLAKVLNASLDDKYADNIRHLYARCLVYLGDLARYRYVHAQQIDLSTEEQDFEVAESYYLRAAHTLPTSGLSYNQLGLLAASKHESLSALYFALRSHLSAIPFADSRANLQSTLNRMSANADDDLQPKQRIAFMLGAMLREQLRGEVSGIKEVDILSDFRTILGSPDTSRIFYIRFVAVCVAASKMVTQPEKFHCVLVQTMHCLANFAKSELSENISYDAESIAVKYLPALSIFCTWAISTTIVCNVTEVKQSIAQLLEGPLARFSSAASNGSPLLSSNLPYENTELQGLDCFPVLLGIDQQYGMPEGEESIAFRFAALKAFVHFSPTDVPVSEVTKPDIHIFSNDSGSSTPPLSPLADASVVRPSPPENSRRLLRVTLPLPPSNARSNPKFQRHNHKHEDKETFDRGASSGQKRALFQINSSNISSSTYTPMPADQQNFQLGKKSEIPNHNKPNRITQASALAGLGSDISKNGAEHNQEKMDDELSSILRNLSKPLISQSPGLLEVSDDTFGEADVVLFQPRSLPIPSQGASDYLSETQHSHLHDEAALLPWQLGMALQQELGLGKDDFSYDDDIENLLNGFAFDNNSSPSVKLQSDEWQYPHMSDSTWLGGLGLTPLPLQVPELLADTAVLVPPPDPQFRVNIATLMPPPGLNKNDGNSPPGLKYFGRPPGL